VYNLYITSKIVLRNTP